MRLPIAQRPAKHDFVPRDIRSINLTLTSYCNMRCPDCCCGIPWKDDSKHHDWAYFEHAAKFFKGIDRIHVTGGEPTGHPKFAEFIPKFRELFGCRLLTIESNGLHFRKHAALMAEFDVVYASIYTAETFEGSPDNREKIAYLKDYYKGQSKPDIRDNVVYHVPRAKRGNKVCHRGLSDTVAYAGGKLYPCCVGPGLDEPHGIELTDNWRDEVVRAYMPCETCFFAEE